MTKTWFTRCALPITSALLLLASLPGGHAQSSFATRPRVAGRVEDSVRTRLQGNVSPVIHVAADQGEADSSAQITHMRLVLTRSKEQKTAFESYLAQLQDKTSPNYHKWLTPEQIGKLYGPADSDIAAATAWLESHGLKVEPIAAFRIDIPFSGTIAQVEEAFQVQMHSFVKGDQRFFANVTAPAIPTALTPIVSGIAHLNTMPPRSFAHRGSMGTYDAAQKRKVAVSPAAIARPDLTTGTSNSNYSLYVVPGDAATIYDTPNTTLNANYTSGTSYTGSGVTIGIGGDSGIQTSTVVDYRTRFLGEDSATSASRILYTNLDNVAENSDAVEAYLDTEISGGIAPGATIHYYPSSDLFSGVVKALNDNAVDIFSLSFGNCEYFLLTSDNEYLNNLWQTAAAEGIAVTVSTGDSGSAGCDATTDSNGNSVPTADVGLQVNGFASTPWNIAVGGTDFDGLLGNFSTYAPAGGSASNYYRTATQYIPESTWNDSTQADGKLSANTPYTGSNANIVAGSGGKSSCSTNTDSASGNNINLGTCTSGYGKPVWQRGTGVPADSARDLPDVSLMAGNGADASSWLICTDDTGTNSNNVTVTANCATQSDSQFYFEGVGGTSAAAPAFAGILALVQQKTGGRLGQAAVELYDLYNGGKASSIFHDITVGNNSVACDSGTPNCSKNTAGYFFETGYDTTAGYDLATGIGSVDAAQLIANWGIGIGASTATVTVTPASSSIGAAQSLTVTGTVTGTYLDASGNVTIPSGTVTLSSGSYTSSAVTLDGGGAYSFTIPAGQLSFGSDTLSVAYSGDMFYGSATGTASVTVNEPSGSSFTVSAAPVSLSAGATTGNTSAITATGSAGYVGPITFTIGSCTLANSPSGAVHAPTCAITTPAVTFAAGASTGSGGLVTISTTAASSAVQKAANTPGSMGTAAGSAIAVAGVLLLLPGRRRRWRALLGAFLLVASISVLSGCGGGSSSGSGGGGTTNPGTTAGSYTFTVTGKDAFGTSASATLNLTVN